MHRFMGSLGLTLVLLTGSSAGADEFAAVPYQHIRQAVDASALKNRGIRDHKVFLRVTSNNPNQNENGIAIWLESHGERTDIDVADDGLFELPEIAAEAMGTAWIRSNQPKGTLSFSVRYQIEMSPPKGRIIENAFVMRYDHLFAGNVLGKDLAKELQSADVGTASRFSGTVLSGMVFSRTDPGEPSRVAIKTGEATIDIRPFGRDSYRIPFDRTLLDAPSVVILVPRRGWKLTAELACDAAEKPGQKEAVNEVGGKSK